VSTLFVCTRQSDCRAGRGRIPSRVERDTEGGRSRCFDAVNDVKTPHNDTLGLRPSRRTRSNANLEEPTTVLTLRNNWETVPAVITYDLSEWANAYVLNHRHSDTVPWRRDPSRTCEPTALGALLVRHGLPYTQAILEFEQHVGGWSAEAGSGLSGLGVFWALTEGPIRSPVAERFRETQRWFASDAERLAGPQAWAYLPLRGTGYPRAFFRDRPLIPAGMVGPEHVYFLGEQGEVYLLLDSLNQLSLAAGSGRTLLERWGLTQRRRSRPFWEVHLCSDVAEELASALDVPKWLPACDDYFAVWATDEVQIRLVRDVAPNIFGTHLAVADSAQLLHAVRRVQALRPHQRLRFWSGANHIHDAGGLAMLLNERFDADVLSGPAPGNYEYTIDPESGEIVFAPSLYDSSEWQ
jgi:hypothetical protein